jgi:hypothetical protein
MFLEAFELGRGFHDLFPEGGRSRIERIIQRIPTPTRKKAETVSVFHVRLPTADKVIRTRSVVATSLHRVTETDRHTSPSPKQSVPTIASSIIQLRRKNREPTAIRTCVTRPSAPTSRNRT